MDGGVTIYPSTVALSACCYSPFMISNSEDGDVCGACRLKWVGVSVWYSEDGNMAFELLSDVR